VSKQISERIHSQNWNWVRSKSLILPTPWKKKWEAEVARNNQKIWKIRKK
jgi:hypothetical protein